MKFCIVTPSYNQAQFLEETIKSVLSQNGDFAVELFVADGGSSDGSKKILKKYSKQIEYVSKKDHGQTDAINKGITHFVQHKHFKAKDTIFAYINSDDYYLPNAFRTVAKDFSEYPDATWLVGDAVIVNAAGEEIQKPVRVYKQLWRKLFSLFTLGVLNPLPQPSTFIRWSTLQEIGQFNQDLRYVMDYEYWLRLMTTGHKPLLIKEPLSSFRIHGQSKGGSQFEKQFAEELHIAQKFISNPLAIWLHKLHNLVVVGVYKVLK